ncbi:MAG: hypothetical protein IJV86_01005 [Clostridia bacterium]|nr:hypothetical protein [Clostridia bacterium]
MTDIIFYDFDFNRLADFPRFISLNFERKYCGYGAAEIHFSLAETEIITLLENNQYVFFTAGENSAVVTGWRIGEDVAVFGRTPEWLLSKRGVEAFSKAGETAEIIARDAVASAAGDFITLDELSGVGTAQSYSTDKVRNLHDVVCEVLEGQSLGFKLVPDIAAKSFVFSVYSGGESLCMISLSNRTAYDMEYTVEKQDMVTNSGWYERKFIDMGGWDAYNNAPALSDNRAKNAYTFYEITSDTYYKSGDKYYPVERFNFNCPKGYYIYSDTPDGKWKITPTKPDTIWIYLNNSEEMGAKRWDAVLSGIKTEAEALAEIALLKKAEKTETETKDAKFGVDYNLGDIVRVQAEFGDFKRAEKKRVSAVNIYYDVDKSGIIPTLNGLEE